MLIMGLTSPFVWDKNEKHADLCGFPKPGSGTALFLMKKKQSSKK